MKKIKIEENNKQQEEQKEKVSHAEQFKDLIRIVLGLLVLVPFFLGTLFSGKIYHISEYDLAISECKDQDQLELCNQLLECLAEATASNTTVSADRKNASAEITIDSDSSRESKSNLDSHLDRVKEFVEEQKLNIHSLDVYLIKRKKERSWKLVRGGSLLLIDTTKLLITNNLTRLVDYIHTFFAEETKTSNFLFYSELLIKICFFKLLIILLTKRGSIINMDPQKLESLGKKALAAESSRIILEICYFILVSLLPCHPSFIRTLPPTWLREMSLLKWTSLSLAVIFIISLVEELTQKKNNDDKEKKTVILNRNFLWKIVIEITLFLLTDFLNSNPFKIRFFTSKKQSKRCYFSLRRTGGFLLLLNRTTATILKTAESWGSKLYQQKNDKAL